MEGKSLTELKAIAKARPDIKGYSKLKKEDLLKLLKSKPPPKPLRKKDKPELSPKLKEALKRDQERRAKAKAKEPKKEPKKKPKGDSDKKYNDEYSKQLLKKRELQKEVKKVKENAKQRPKPQKAVVIPPKKREVKMPIRKVVPKKKEEPKKRGRKAYKPNLKVGREEGEVPKRKPPISKEFKLKKNTKTVPPTPRQPKKLKKIIPPPKPPTSKEDRLAKGNYSPNVYKRLYEDADDDDGDIFTEMDEKALRLKPVGFSAYGSLPTSVSAHPDDTNPMGDNPTGFTPIGFFTSPPKKKVIKSKPIETATDKYYKSLGKKPRAETLDEIIERKADENKKRFIKKAPAPTKTKLEDNPSSISFFHNSSKGIKRKPFVKKAPYKEPRKTDLNKKGKAKELISRDNRLPVAKIVNTPTTSTPAKTVKTTTKTNNLRVKPKEVAKVVSKVSKTRVASTPNPMEERKVKKDLPEEVKKALAQKKEATSVPVSMPKMKYEAPPEMSNYSSWADTMLPSVAPAKVRRGGGYLQQLEEQIFTKEEIQKNLQEGEVDNLMDLFQAEKNAPSLQEENNADNLIDMFQSKTFANNQIRPDAILTPSRITVRKKGQEYGRVPTTSKTLPSSAPYGKSRLTNEEVRVQGRSKKEVKGGEIAYVKSGFNYVDAIVDVKLSAEELDTLKNRPLRDENAKRPPSILETSIINRAGYSKIADIYYAPDLDKIPSVRRGGKNTVKGKEKGVPNPDLPDLFYPQGDSNYGNTTSVLPAFLPKKVSLVLQGDGKTEPFRKVFSRDTEYKTKSLKPSSYDRITPARRGQPIQVLDTTPGSKGEFDNIVYPNAVREIRGDLKEDRKRDTKALKASMETGTFINQINPNQAQGNFSRTSNAKKIRKKGGDTFGQEFQDYKRINEPLAVPFLTELRATHNRVIAEKGKKPVGSSNKSGGNQLNPDFRRGAKRTGYTDYRTYQAPRQDEGDFFGEEDFTLGSNQLADLQEDTDYRGDNEGGLVGGADVIGKQKKGKRTYPKPSKKDLVEKKGANPFVRGGKERKLTGKFATSGKVRREKDYKEPDKEEKKKAVKKVEFTKVGDIEKGSGKKITIAEGEWNGYEFIYNGKTKTITADDPSLLALGGGGKKIYFDNIPTNKKDTEIVPVPKEIFRSAQSTVGRDKKLEGKMVGGEATEAQKTKLNAGLLKGIERKKARKEGKKVDDTNESVFTKKGKQEFADKYTRKGVPKEVIKRFLGEEVKSSPLTKYSSKDDAFTKMSKKLEKSLTSTGTEKSKKKDDEYIKKRKEFQDKFAEFMKTANAKLKSGTAGENKKTSAQMTKKRERLDINLKKLAEKYGK